MRGPSQDYRLWPIHERSIRGQGSPIRLQAIVVHKCSIDRRSGDSHIAPAICNPQYVAKQRSFSGRTLALTRWNIPVRFYDRVRFGRRWDGQDPRGFMAGLGLTRTGRFAILEHLVRLQRGPTRIVGRRLTLLSALIAGAANAMPVTLVWDPPVGYVPAGYVVGYGEVSGAYATEVDVGAVRTYTVPDLASGRTYYFSVKAYAGGEFERVGARGRRCRAQRTAASVSPVLAGRSDSGPTPTRSAPDTRSISSMECSSSPSTRTRPAVKRSGTSLRARSWVQPSRRDWTSSLADNASAAHTPGRRRPPEATARSRFVSRRRPQRPSSCPRAGSPRFDRFRSSLHDRAKSIGAAHQGKSPARAGLFSDGCLTMIYLGAGRRFADRLP